MHEESLIRSLLKQVEELANSHQAVSVSCIEVEVGPLSGVEPELLRSAFSRLQPSVFRQPAELCVHETGLIVQCLDCRTESQIRNFRFFCPACRSSSLQILKGDEFRLLNVTLQVEDTAA
jgi:hydrogenase nickel incorporation protein HypA/HybF